MISIATESIKPEKTNPRIKYDMTLPMRLITSIGFLPYLSDSPPQIGVKKNCIKEKMPATSPIVDSFMWRTLMEKEGSKGMIIPNPSRSINIMRNITNNAGFFLTSLAN